MAGSEFQDFSSLPKDRFLICYTLLAKTGFIWFWVVEYQGKHKVEFNENQQKLKKWPQMAKNWGKASKVNKNCMNTGIL